MILTLAISVRSHEPQQGPQALASTLLFSLSNTSMIPAFWSVCRVCSLPGERRRGILGVRPASRACSARLAARERSSKEELVHEPMRPAVRLGHDFSSALPRNWLTGVDRSGVKGPLMRGSRVERSISMTLSYSAPGSAQSSWAANCTARAISWRCVDSR